MQRLNSPDRTRVSASALLVPERVPINPSNPVNAAVQQQQQQQQLPKQCVSCSRSAQQKIVLALIGLLLLTATALIIAIVNYPQPSPYSTKSTVLASKLQASTPHSNDPASLLLVHEKSVDITAPLNRERLGAIGWTFFHTIAANLPQTLTPELIVSIQQFVAAIGVLYPCQVCAAHFKAYTEAHPMQIQTKRDVIVWVCEAHNAVNRRLNKTVVDCQNDAFMTSLWPHHLAADCGCSVDGQYTNIQSDSELSAPSLYPPTEVQQHHQQYGQEEESRIPNSSPFNALTNKRLLSKFPFFKSQ